MQPGKEETKAMQETYTMYYMSNHQQINDKWRETKPKNSLFTNKRFKPFSLRPQC